MAIVANSIGTSVTAEAKKPMFSLLQRRITHTPEGHAIDHFFPFTDLTLAPSGSDTGNIMATFKAPACLTLSPKEHSGLHGSPSNFVTGKDKGKALKSGDAPYAGEKLASHIWPLNTDAASQASGKLGVKHSFIGPNGAVEEEDCLKEFSTQEAAVRWVSQDSLLERIGIVRTPKGVKVIYHDMFLYKMADRLRNVHQFLGRWKPQMSFIGLGHMDEDQKVVRPGMTWTVGNAFWREKRYEGAGYTYFPMDYVPYGTMKRVGAYWSIYHSLMYAWFNSLADAEKTNYLQRFPNGDSGQQTDTICAMMQLYHASHYGTTESPSAPETAPNHQQIIDGMKHHLVEDVTSGYYHIDPARMDKDQLQQFICWNMIKAMALSFSSGVQTPVVPGQLVYLGGPKPQDVSNKFIMNFRPDTVIGSPGSDLPFTLLPTHLYNGNVTTRIPTMFVQQDGLNKGGKFSKQGQADRCTWYGPRDPLVLEGATAEQYLGDDPLSQTEEEYYYASPVIDREGKVYRIYNNHRYFNCDHFPRPQFFMGNVTNMGHVFSLMADHQSIGGSYFEQPIQKIIFDKEGIKRVSGKNGLQRLMRKQGKMNEPWTKGTAQMLTSEERVLFDDPTKQEESVEDADAQVDHMDNVEFIDAPNDGPETYSVYYKDQSRTE